MEPQTLTYLIITQTRNGYGVVAGKNFVAGEIICEFHGQLYSREELPQPYDSVDDHYVQIGENLYMRPSGEVDDFFNHSCDPNAGLKIIETRVVLIAIKNISIGEEITWDYSTTMDEDEWEMECNCGSQNCRGKVRDFKYLPSEIQQKYLNLGIVPEYIVKKYFPDYQSPSTPKQGLVKTKLIDNR